MIDLEIPRGTFQIRTKRVGNNPKIQVLRLHGGLGATHEHFEAFDSYFLNSGIEYYYYDRLGSAYSDGRTRLSCGMYCASSKKSNSSLSVGLKPCQPAGA